MAVVLGVLVPGAARRLEDDCPDCGWADLWQVTIHSLSDAGVGDVAVTTMCARCRGGRDFRKIRA